MAFLRFNRDRRGYEHFYLVEPTTNRRGKVRARVLYWFRTPPNVKVGREPFDREVRRALETQNPRVTFDWRKIAETPIPSADVERWRERRRAERAAQRGVPREAGEVGESGERGKPGEPSRPGEPGEPGASEGSAERGAASEPSGLVEEDQIDAVPAVAIDAAERQEDSLESIDLRELDPREPSVEIAPVRPLDDRPSAAPGAPNVDRTHKRRRRRRGRRGRPHVQTLPQHLGQPATDLASAPADSSKAGARTDSPEPSSSGGSGRNDV